MSIHSDWGDWLPKAIADADPEGLAVWYLGCNGFALKAEDGTTVFIDPYLGTGDPPRTVRMIPVPFDPADVEHVDAVLATHEHVDHAHGPSQAPLLEGADAEFYGPLASAEQARAWSDEYEVDTEDVTEVTEGETISVGALDIAVEPANDPDADHPVSYAVQHDAGTFFHGGDARPSGAFEGVGERYDIDLGALAFGSVGMIPDKETREPERTRWYADENGVVEAASALGLDRLLPSHWDMWKGLTADPTALYEHARSFDHPRSIEVVEIGDRVDL
jgi:L-ascorbate 6-phosphate lactonase